MSVDRLQPSSLFVVVPFYNEEQGILPTLRALASQTDPDFGIVLVDNGSTDASQAVVREFLAEQPRLWAEVIEEPQKGTGAAADSGFRYAIDRGATYVARTDADCLPRTDWTAMIKLAFEGGLDFVIGTVKPRLDDGRVTWLDRAFVDLFIRLADTYGRFAFRDSSFKRSYRLVAGNNLALRSDLYVAAGGFPRGSLEDQHEDRVLSDNVRRLTAAIERRGNVVVYNSLRRVRRYGYLHTLLWYWDHKYRPGVVDVR